MGPREVNRYTQFCGAWGPRTTGTPGGPQYTHLCRDWGPRTTGIPGSQQIYTIMKGLGAPYNRDPGRSTNIRNYVGPGGPVQQRSREVNKYTHLCGAWGPRTTGIPGGQQIYALMRGPGAPPRTTKTPGGDIHGPKPYNLHGLVTSMAPNRVNL